MTTTHRFFRNHPRRLVRLAPAAVLVFCVFNTTVDSATFVVDRTDDPALFGWDCTLTPNDCSLRGAVYRANVDSVHDDIILNANTYTIDLDVGIDTGDLEISEDVDIIGNGAVIDVQLPDRAIRIMSATTMVKITDVTIQGGNPSGNGAGIFNKGMLTLERTTITNNITNWEGGGVANASSGQLTIIESTISLNEAHKGGGVDNQASGYVNVTNSTLAFNRASSGWGTALENAGTIDLKNVTISPNEDGGDISNESGGQINLVNTLIDGVCWNFGTMTSFGGNVSIDLNCIGTDDIWNVDSRLGSFAHHGGSTKCFELRPDSPAIDAGVDLHFLPCPDTDQRGAERPEDGDGDQVATCDSGAYERGSYDVFVDGFESGDTSVWSSIVGG